MSNTMNFTVSDLVAGYVTSYDADTDIVTLSTTDKREYEVKLTETTFAERVRNLGEPYADATGQLRDLLAPGRLLFAYGVFYPESGGVAFEGKHIVLLGVTEDEYTFEKPDWWVVQVRALADYYLRAQFGGGPIDYRNYRTTINLEGEHTEGTFRQETDTISRLVYGFATAYLMTGEDRFLEAAEAGTQYLRDHMRSVDSAAGIVYWAHAIDVDGATERKVLASEFGDDYDALPAYEQIYALAGPTQTYRVTGDPAILDDIKKTVALFDKYYLDPDKGGYWSHLDPVTFSGTADNLGRNRSRKNWNSVGDHAPAYLINAYLATGEKELGEFLAATADTIVERFPDYDHSPFVNEKFHEDWSPDHHWGWQQNRGVVGHNLKIAWNLMRINSLQPDTKYVELAEKIAAIMPTVGCDRQRLGWYDVMERELKPGEELHRFVWHDRKAWWQQEQAILAYLILAGITNNPEHLRLGRESAAFYNAWFLDQDSGGVYFNVLANGIPYLLGTERLKGSHSMSGYHSFELAYLAAVYTNLLITHQPMDLYFKPKATSFPDGILRVSPDILPAGSIRIEEVTIDGQPWTDFDANALTVTLPGRDCAVKVRVAAALELFENEIEAASGTTTMHLAGRIEDSVVRLFERELEQVVATAPTKLVLDLTKVTELSPSAVRAVMMARQKLPLDSSHDIVVTGASDDVEATLLAADPDRGGVKLQ